MILLGKSDIGRARATNQDAFTVGELPGGAVFAVVCDGMGGAKGGNIASLAACDIISQKIKKDYKEGMSANSVKAMLQSVISEANASIYDMAAKDEALEGMGTTAVIALVVNRLAHIVHVGDSRAYYLNKDGIVRLTRDHSVVQDLLETGQLTEQEARKHPKKNIITKAIGVEKKIESDYCQQLLGENEAVLMCTDGLTNYIDDEFIYNYYLQHSISELPDRLIEVANDCGGGDNITIVVIS